MLQEDLDEITGPSMIRSVVEGGHPNKVPTINRDTRREQDIEQFGVVVWVAAIESHTFDVPNDNQSRIRVAQGLLLPCKVGSMALRTE